MKIRLLASSDIHGSVMPYQYSNNKPCNHGFAKLKATMDAYTIDNTLRIDNGDILEGSPLLAYYHSHLDGEHPMTTCMNLSNYDYINLGNHDLNNGQAILLDYLKHNKAKMLVGNIKLNGEYLGAEYTIHEFDKNHRIALIGAVTHYLVNWEKAVNMQGIEVEDAFEFVKRSVAKVKETENVQGIVVVYHGGFEKDMESGKPTEQLTGENQGYRMCEEIPGIDILISGHQHRSFATTSNGVHTTQTSANAAEIAIYDWDLDTKEISQKVVSCDKEADSEIIKAIKPLEDKVQVWLDETMGEVQNVDLEVKDEFDARLHKHPVISFINTVQKEAAGAMLSGNALFNGAVGFKKTITMRDIVSTYVYPNTVVAYTITGKILKEYLEKSAEYFDIKHDEITISDSYNYPKPQHYNYDMVDGIDYTIKVSNPIGTRIIDLKYQGQDIKEDDTFTLALSNYRASGGGNFFMFKDCPIYKDVQTDMVTLIAEYLTKHPKLYVDHQENIKVII